MLCVEADMHVYDIWGKMGPVPYPLVYGIHILPLDTSQGHLAERHLIVIS